MQEIKECRRETKLPESINHHLQRVYEHEGNFYMLDKTMDGVPPFYTFYALSFDPRVKSGIPDKVKIEDKEYWGDGLTWEHAEEKIRPIILTDGL